jgi:dTDP-4-amino-4,6-dideoxygalactose transaminase
MNIPFNIPYISKKAKRNFQELLKYSHFSGSGPFTNKCVDFIKEHFGICNSLLTTSCTDALEMSSILANIKPGDEVIVPAYTYVSTALAFSRQGAQIIFTDSRIDSPNIDEGKIENLITGKTKAVVPVHYAGIPCEMDSIMEIAEKHHILVIEDAANAFGSSYKGRPAGTIGHFGCYSFHETKLVHCGEGGMLTVKEDSTYQRAEIIWDKGTNRGDFHRGQVSKYEWIDNGSSFLMSDINSAFLFGQLIDYDLIFSQRKHLWEQYYNSLQHLHDSGLITLPFIPAGIDPNYSVFYFVTNNLKDRDLLLKTLNSNGIQAIFHYLDLSQSPFIRKFQPGNVRQDLNNAQKYQDRLIRLPFYYSLTSKQIATITRIIDNYFKK